MAPSEVTYFLRKKVIIHSVSKKASSEAFYYASECIQNNPTRVTGFSCHYSLAKLMTNLAQKIHMFVILCVSWDTPE